MHMRSHQSLSGRLGSARDDWAWRDPNLDSTYTLQSDTMAIFSLWRPPALNYNGISITHTSLGHTPVCMRRINGQFSSCAWKWKRYLLKNIYIYVFCYARKPLATAQNGLDSRVCVPDRICIKLSRGTLGARKIFKHFWAYWTVISYTCFFQYHRDK